MAQSVDAMQSRDACRFIGASIPNDAASVRGTHQGPQSVRTGPIDLMTAREDYSTRYIISCGVGAIHT